jgi:hypothetical protein
MISTRNVTIFILSLFFATSVQAMVAKHPESTGQPAPTAQKTTTRQSKHHGRDEKIYLLSFDGKYLRTTAGTLYAPAVKIVTHGQTDLRKLKDTNKTEVKFTVVDRRVKQVDVYPDGGQ